MPANQVLRDGVLRIYVAGLRPPPPPFKTASGLPISLFTCYLIEFLFNDQLIGRPEADLNVGVPPPHAMAPGRPPRIIL